VAVYTEVDDLELADFVAGYDIGGILSCKGIAEGATICSRPKPANTF